MKNLIILAALALGGCATATEIYGPDGQKAVMIECNGAAVPMSKCFEKAAEVCPTGYALIGGSQTGSMASVGPYAGFAASGMNKSIIVRCKS